MDPDADGRAGSPGALPASASWQGRRVLVTGHTGFKGCWLACWLQHLGAEVHGLSLEAEPGTLGAALRIEARLPSIRQDIRDIAGLCSAVADVRPEIVFHLAAQALVRRSYSDPLETWQTNVMGTAHLLEAVRRVESVRAVVVVTSDKCYENREWLWSYRESDALGGHDPYSASKAAAELVVACWRRSFIASRQVAVASVRAGNVIGGGDWSVDRLVPDCIRAFAAGAAVRIRNPAATRPWQHVLDPLCGYLLLAERLLHDGDAACAWNFGPAPDEVRPVSEVVRVLAEAWGPGAAWTFDAGPHPHEAGYLAVDAALARARLGWQSRLRLTEALRRTVDWYRQSLAGEDAHRLIHADIGRYV